ncbi:MAG: SLC13/DASS family transporter [Deltaproteobacteria bacterium]|nr:SLC13/DASS family transporter [Deltaproteobacteria bacterium]
MDTITDGLVRFWDWQWEMHYRIKDFLKFRSVSKKKESSYMNSSQISGEGGNKISAASPTEARTASPPGSSPKKEKGKEPYSLRNKVGLIGGVVVLLAALAMPPLLSMHNVAGKMALKSATPQLLQAGAADDVLVLDGKGKISKIPDTERFLAWSKPKAPKTYSAVAKKATAMKNCLAVMLIMVIWWICESVPWGVTALLPVALFPIVGVASAAKASAPYAHKIIILFIAAFFIAEAMLKWNFHRRVALFIVDKIGISPKRIVLGFMVACAFLSMWISNTATAMMMMPMALAIILHTAEVGKRLQDKGQLPGVDFTEGAYVFGSCLMLGIAFACNSGGMGTLIGTPPNIIYSGQLEMLFPDAPKVDFARWLALGFPLSWITTLGLWAMLVFVLRRPEIREIPGGSRLIKEERRKLGPWSAGEKAVGVILLITALAWIFRAEKHIGGVTIYGLSTLFPWIHDSTVAVIMAILLFAVPISMEKNEFALTWDWAIKIPWGIVLLFGGGFSLAAGINATGAATWVAHQLTGLAGWPLIWLMIAIAVVIAAISTVATNTATATVFMPILGTMAVATAFDPRFLMILGCLASQCAYALPVSTTPNAICFGSGYIRMLDMVRVGIICSIVSILIAVLGSLIFMGPAFGVAPHVVPPWAVGG